MPWVVLSRLGASSPVLEDEDAGMPDLTDDGAHRLRGEFKNRGV